MGAVLMGPAARVLIAKVPGSSSVRYEGEILAESDLHILQRIGATEAIAHFKSRLERVPAVGECCRILYKTSGSATVTALSGF
jgi:hypothetical protein